MAEKKSVSNVDSDGTDLRPKLKNFFIFNPKLGNKEGEEHKKILYYYPEDENMDTKVKTVGLTTAIIAFSGSFNPDESCEAIVSKKKKQVFFQAEPDLWISMTVLVPHASVIIEGEQVTEYFDDTVNKMALQGILKLAYRTFLLFHGFFEDIIDLVGQSSLVQQLSDFYSTYVPSINFKDLSIFTVYEGIQFLPLNTAVFMKAHQFVNKLESQNKYLKRVVIMHHNQLVWSGLEREDMQVFYNYLTTSLIPQHGEVDSSMKQSLVKLPLISAPPPSDNSKGVYLLGPNTGELDALKCKLAHIVVDGEMKRCQLAVYNTMNISLCLFFQTDVTSKVIKKLESTYAELRSIAQQIQDFKNKSKATQIDLQYRYIYFNSMNLAVKSPMLYKKGSVVSVFNQKEMMRLLIDVDKEHQHLDVCEVIMQTEVNMWLVYRKSGQRQFAVFFQKGLNFFDVCEEVRKLCEKEFSSVFILD